MRFVGPLLVVVLVAACTAQSPSSQRPTASVQLASTPTAAPSRPLIEVLRDQQVVLIDLTGRLVAATERFPAGPDGFVGIVPVGAGGDRAAYLNTATGVLWALHRDGSIERLATTTVSYQQVLLSPDGQQWAWVEQTTAQDGSVDSRLHIDGPNGDRVVQEASFAQQALRPYRWDRSGLVVESETIGLMSPPPLDPASGPVELVNLQTGAIQPLNLPPKCAFVALAVDGTTACQDQLASGTNLTISRPDHTTSSISLPTPRFNYVGNASFRPGSSETLVIGGDSWDRAHLSDAGRLATGLLNARVGGALQPFGPVGITPAAGEDWVWLGGGQMIGEGWLNDPGSDSGVWLYSADGTARRISSGQAFGVLA